MTADTLTAARDRALVDLVNQVDDLGLVAVIGASLIRQAAFLRWCPHCRDGAHPHRRDGRCGTRDSVSGRRCACPVAAWMHGNLAPLDDWGTVLAGVRRRRGDPTVHMLSL